LKEARYYSAAFTMASMHCAQIVLNTK